MGSLPGVALRANPRLISQQRSALRDERYLPSQALHIEFLIVDPGGVRLLDRQCSAVLRHLFRIDRDCSVSIVRSLDRVRIDQLVGNFAHIAPRGQVRLSIEGDRMNLGAR